MKPETIPAPRPRRFNVVALPRYSAVKLLGALALLFVIAPFVEELPRGDLIEAILLTLVMVFAVLAVGGRGRTLGIALLSELTKLSLVRGKQTQVHFRI